MAASGIGVAGAVTGLGTRLAFAAPGSPDTGDTLVVVNLRGGADGLSIAPPYGYQSYRQLRPTIAVDPPGGANGALPLTAGSSNGNAVFPSGMDGVVGLHPAFKPLYDALWSEGKLAVVPACGQTESRTRSHFEATTNLEAGSANGVVGGGWLGRMLNVQNTGGAIPGVTISTRSDMLRGGAGAIEVPNLGSFGLNWFRREEEATAALQTMYSGADSVSAEGRNVLAVMDRIAAIDSERRPGYPDTGLGGRLSELASMLKADLGVHAAAVETGGWDHHNNHGPVGNGRFHDNATELADALAAFANDTNGLEEITVVVTTEFGRTINENGSRGTDHGRAATFLAMGGGVQGGVFGDDYPDEIKDDPDYGDLTVMTDFRKPISELIMNRAGVDNMGVVFPTYEGQGTLGLTR